jgi:hypothetical protein
MDWKCALELGKVVRASRLRRSRQGSGRCGRTSGRYCDSFRLRIPLAIVVWHLPVGSTLTRLFHSNCWLYIVYTIFHFMDPPLTVSCFTGE